MPTERRRIIFSDDEVILATVTHCRATGIALPDAEVDDLDIALESDCSVSLSFAITSPEQVDELTLDPETLLSALIGFCRNRSIPIPKSASKRLEAKDGCLSMVFDMRRARGSLRKSAPADAALFL